MSNWPQTIMGRLSTGGVDLSTELWFMVHSLWISEYIFIVAGGEFSHERTLSDCLITVDGLVVVNCELWFIVHCYVETVIPEGSFTASIANGGGGDYIRLHAYNLPESGAFTFFFFFSPLCTSGKANILCWLSQQGVEVDSKPRSQSQASHFSQGGRSQQGPRGGKSRPRPASSAQSVSATSAFFPDDGPHGAASNKKIGKREA